MADTTAVSADKIKCEIDGAMVHSVQLHIERNHPEWSMERYRQTYPNAPLYSEAAKKKLREASARTEPVTTAAASEKRPMHEVFDLGNSVAARNARGEPIMVTVLADDPLTVDMIPAIDPNYVFNIETLKNFIIGMEFGMPELGWGLHGTGKSTLFEQIAARTRRPLMRVQHTINTEEAHVLGQYVVRDGGTHFQLGPLPIAMMQGLVYLADEYDIAVPSVLAVYQPVMEGKPLFIKDAPPEVRLVKPHPNFRFCATGNTNGGGDETGLYQGTQLQNAANYSRFGITVELGYLEAKQETIAVAGQARIDKASAEKLVKFATEIRKEFAAGKIGNVCSTRELIRAGQLGMMKGANWREGLRLAFINRLSRVDNKLADEFAQRIFT